MQYTIKSGDTLSGIAKRFGTTVAAIAVANKDVIKNVNVIHTGDVITIPGAPATDTKYYTALGKSVEKCLADIEKLDSFKEVMKAFNG